MSISGIRLRSSITGSNMPRSPRRLLRALQSEGLINELKRNSIVLKDSMENDNPCKAMVDEIFRGMEDNVQKILLENLK